MQLLLRLFGQQQQPQGTQYNWQQPGFQGAQAQSRFTQTPIDIRPSEEQQAWGQYGQTTQAPWTTSAFVTPQTSPQQLQQILHHEDVHAALDPARYKGPRSYEIPVDVDDRVSKQFAKAQRGGNPDVEMPAYMSTYNPSEVPGLSQQDVQQWNQGFQQGLPNPVLQLLQRIIASHQSSQK